MYFSLRRSIALVISFGLLVSLGGLYAAHYGAGAAVGLSGDAIDSMAIISAPSSAQKRAIASRVRLALAGAQHAFDVASVATSSNPKPSQHFNFLVQPTPHDDYHITLDIFGTASKTVREIVSNQQRLITALTAFARGHSIYDSNVYELQLFVCFVDRDGKSLPSKHYVMPYSASLRSHDGSVHDISSLPTEADGYISRCHLVLKVGTGKKLVVDWAPERSRLDACVAGRDSRFDDNMQTHITIATLVKYSAAKMRLPAAERGRPNNFIKNGSMNDFAVIAHAFKAASRALQPCVHYPLKVSERCFMSLPLDTLALSVRKNDRTKQTVHTVALSVAGAAVVGVGAAAGFGSAAARPATGYDAPCTPSYPARDEYAPSGGASAAAAGCGYGGAGARPVSAYGAAAAAWPAHTPADDELARLTELFRAGVLDRDAYDRLCADARSGSSTGAPRYDGAAGYGYGGGSSGAGSGKGFGYGAVVVPTSQGAADELARARQALAEYELSPLTDKEREGILTKGWTCKTILRGRGMM